MYKWQNIWKMHPNARDKYWAQTKPKMDKELLEQAIELMRGSLTSLFGGRHEDHEPCRCCYHTIFHHYERLGGSYDNLEKVQEKQQTKNG